MQSWLYVLLITPFHPTAPPPPPRFLEVTQKGATWVEIRWMANPDTNPPIQSYNVEYRLSFELQRQQDNGTLIMRFNITGLYPSAQYLVQVRAESPKGIGEPSTEISVWTEPGGRPCVTWRVGGLWSGECFFHFHCSHVYTRHLLSDLHLA